MSVTAKLLSLVKRADGDLESNPELQRKVLGHLVRLAGMGLLGGAALRTGMSVLRNTNPRYEPPDPPKPVVVDVPYPAPRELGGIPLTDPKKEKQVKLGGDLDWLTNSFIGRHLIPDYTSPMGGPDAKEPWDVPLTAAAGIPLAGAAGLGGFHVADKILRAADRNKARGELDDAKREYQQTMIKRLMASRLPTKSAADASASSDPIIQRIKVALDQAYDAIQAKKAGDPEPAVPAGQYNPPGQSRKLLMSLLFPGTMFGRTGALANMGLVGTLAGVGGYAGYNYSRDPEAADSIRKAVKKRDEEDAAKLPSPMIARMVPVPQG